MNIFRRVSLLLVFLCLVGQAKAQKIPRYPVEQYTLKNGLRVVLSEDHSIPLISLVVGYDVGSRNEVKGRTGFAHLFEHMMFQGSANVPRNEHGRYLESNGGEYNGATADEMTYYECSVPAEKLPLVLWLEADRMRSLAVTADNFKNQKDVVKEEKRLRIDNQPYAIARQKLQATAYTNFANSHMTIGSMSDLDAATLEDVQAFFKTYYCPNNAVLVLTGDFDPAQARTLIEKLYGGIARGADPPKTDTSEPAQTQERKASIVDTFATTPATFLAWPGPSLSHPDTEPMDILFDMVFKQEAQRATSDIGAGSQWVYAFEGGLRSQGGPSQIMLMAIHRDDIASQTIRDEVFVQVNRLQKDLPSKEEVERVKTNYLARHYRQEIEPLNQRAIGLCTFALKMKDAAQFYASFDRYQAVTPERIQEVARKYLKPETCTFLEIKTGKKPGKEGDGDEN